MRKTRISFLEFLFPISEKLMRAGKFLILRNFQLPLNSASKILLLLFYLIINAVFACLPEEFFTGPPPSHPGDNDLWSTRRHSPPASRVLNKVLRLKAQFYFFRRWSFANQWAFEYLKANFSDLFFKFFQHINTLNVKISKKFLQKWNPIPALC